MAREASLRQYNSADSNRQTVRNRLMTQQTKVLQKKGTLQVIRRVLPIRQDNAYSFCFTGAETEIHKIKDNSKIIRQTNLIAAV
jgi:hypothetical protein